MILVDEVPNIVALDANALAFLCRRDGDDNLRLQHLLERVDKKKGRVLLPTPAIAEFLVRADQAGEDILDLLQKKSSILIASFDLAAARENALLDAAALGRGDKKDESTSAWQKIKVDRQIVAIAKSRGAALIVSNDAGVKSNARRAGINAVRIDELPFSEQHRQHVMPLPGE